MKATFPIFLILAVFFLGGLSHTSLHGSTEAELKQNIMNRLPEVDAMKKRGLVGENNLGYLEARRTLQEEQTVTVDAENADRKALYQMIGERTGVPTEKVGKSRAEDIRKNSAPGVWLQDEDGTWYRKS